MLLLAGAARAELPVRIEIGEAVFIPQAEVSFRQNLRTMSTPPYTLIMRAPDARAFAAFTADEVGQIMDVIVCDEVVFSPSLRTLIPNGRVDIHNAPVGGLLETFIGQGCP